MYWNYTYLLVLKPLYNPLFLNVGRIHDLLLTNSMQWPDVTSTIMIVMSVSLGHSLWLALRKQTALLDGSMCQGLGTAFCHSQWQTEALSSTVCKNPHVNDNPMSLEVELSSVKPSDENPTLADSLNSALQEAYRSCAWTLTPQSMWNNKYCSKSLSLW